MSEQLLEQAGRNPNQTSSASFNFAPGNAPGDSIWIWCVSVTDVAVPDAYYNASGLHVVNTQWDLQWPGGGSLQSFMVRAGNANKTGQGLCISRCVGHRMEFGLVVIHVHEHERLGLDRYIITMAKRAVADEESSECFPQLHDDGGRM